MFSKDGMLNVKFCDIYRRQKLKYTVIVARCVVSWAF